MPKLTGHALVKAGQCHDCGGPLFSSDGTFSERLVDNGRRAFAAPICNACKRKQHENATADAADKKPGKKRRISHAQP